MGKTWGAFHHRCPRDALVIDDTEYQVGQQGVEIPVLFGQIVANHLGPDHGHAFGHANRFLQVPFAGMPRGLFNRIHGHHLPRAQPGAS